MYNSFINKEVTVIVASRADSILEYNGLLCEENEKTIKLKNVSINLAMLNFQKNLFGSNMGDYYENIEEMIINKDYIISCNTK